LSDHRRFSPSGASRWLACPGSVFGPQDNSSSVYADEGTAAHSLANECWMLGTCPTDRIGETINGFTITEEMAQAVQIFLDEISSMESLLGDAGKVRIETRMEVHFEDPDNPDFGGTADAVVWSANSVAIIDFKYGAGVAVEVTENPQLKCYALLAMKHLKTTGSVSYTHLRAHETPEHLVCRLLLEKKKKYIKHTRL